MIRFAVCYGAGRLCGSAIRAMIGRRRRRKFAREVAAELSGYQLYVAQIYRSA